MLVEPHMYVKFLQELTELDAKKKARLDKEIFKTTRALEIVDHIKENKTHAKHIIDYQILRKNQLSKNNEMNHLSAKEKRKAIEDENYKF